jgi:hypothetical protein
VLLALEQKAFPLIPAPGLFVFADAAQPDFVGQKCSREGKQQPADRTSLIFGRDKELVEIFFGKLSASIAANLPSSATKRLQPFSISAGMRPRRFASNLSLAVSSPVETQLSIQTRAISPYSSTRAGRIAESETAMTFKP